MRSIGPAIVSYVFMYVTRLMHLILPPPRADVVRMRDMIIIMNTPYEASILRYRVPASSSSSDGPELLHVFHEREVGVVLRWLLGSVLCR